MSGSGLPFSAVAPGSDGLVRIFPPLCSPLFMRHSSFRPHGNFTAIHSPSPYSGEGFFFRFFILFSEELRSGTRNIFRPNLSIRISICTTKNILQKIRIDPEKKQVQKTRTEQEKAILNGNGFICKRFFSFPIDFFISRDTLYKKSMQRGLAGEQRTGFAAGSRRRFQGEQYRRKWKSTKKNGGNAMTLEHGILGFLSTSPQRGTT